jgi:hypothetical protein
VVERAPEGRGQSGGAAVPVGIVVVKLDSAGSSVTTASEESS